jgi:hypothetical protein
MKWKISISENALKYTGGGSFCLILLIVGAYMIFTNITELNHNTAIGMVLIIFGGFIGFLLFRSTERK